MGKYGNGFLNRRRKQFWKKTLAVALSTAFTVGQFSFPLQVVGAEAPGWESLDNNEGFALPEGIGLADSRDAVSLYQDDARITDYDLLEEMFALRDSLIENLALSLEGPLGAVGFEGDFALDNPNSLINISVQFVTPPVEALRILENANPAALSRARSRVAAVDFEAVALEAHSNFEAQLSGLPVSRARSAQPRILSSHYTLFNGVFMTVPQNMVEAIAALPEVFVVTPEATFYAVSDLENPVVNDGVDVYEIVDGEVVEVSAAVSDRTPTDYFMEQALDALGIADIVAERGLTGRDIRVGVLDTGIDYYHPAFYDSRYIVDGRISHRGWDFVDDRPSPMEARPGEVSAWDPSPGGHGPTTHGTHVAGSVVAVAPGVTLYHYRVLFGSTPGHIISQGIERAFDDKVDIMNLSLGGNFNNPFAPDVYKLNLASLKGIVVVIAAGNNMAHIPGSLGTPGVASLPITVGNAQTGGIGYNRLAGGAYVDEENIFMELRGNQFLFDGDAIDGEFEWVNLGQLSDLPTVPTAEFLADFRAEFLDGDDLSGRIAVVKRGGTTFATMRTLVQALNASGMILVDNQPANGENSLANINTPLDGPGGTNRIPFFATQLAYWPLFEDYGTVVFSEVYYVPLSDNMNPSSSRGPVAVAYHISPDVVAPGTRIVSAVPSFAVSPNPADWNNHRYAYDAASGTSMAAPAVAGVVALMLEAMPELEPWEVKARLMATARPLEGTPSDAVQATNGGDFYSVLNVGAGFVRPGLALEADAAFATVENEIPWLNSGSPGWSRQRESALNFGNIIGLESSALTVELHNGGAAEWSYTLTWNGSNEGAQLVELDRTANSFTFQLVFGEDTADRFFEGNLVFADGAQQVTVPFGGRNGAEQASLYVDPDHLGIIRPIISGFVLEYAGQDDPRGVRTDLINAMTASNITAAQFNIQNPNHSFSYGVAGVAGPSVGTVFYAVRYDEDGEAEEEFVVGIFDVPTNMDFNLADFVSAGMGGRLLPDGVYTFYADIMDAQSPFTTEIGRFVVTSERPEIRFDEEVFYFVPAETNDAVRLSGSVFSRGHELAIAHDVRSSDLIYIAGPYIGQNPVFDYRFSMWQIERMIPIDATAALDPTTGEFDFYFVPENIAAILARHEPMFEYTRLLEGSGPTLLTSPPSLISANVSESTSFGFQQYGVRVGRFELGDDVEFEGAVQFNYDYNEVTFREFQLPNPILRPIPTIYIDFGQLMEEMTGNLTMFNRNMNFVLFNDDLFPGWNWVMSYPFAALGIDVDDPSTWRFGYGLELSGPFYSIGASPEFAGDWQVRVAVGGAQGTLFRYESSPITINIDPLPVGGMEFEYSGWPEVYYIVQGEQARLSIGYTAIPENAEQVGFWWRHNGRLHGATQPIGFNSLELSGYVDFLQPLQNFHQVSTIVGTWELTTWVMVDGEWIYTATSSPMELREGVGEAIWREVPGEDDPYEPTDPVYPEYPAWDSAAPFNTGNRVIYDGRVFEAQWWTQNEVPGSTPWGAWMEIGEYVYIADFGYVTTWTASRVFDNGDLVVYDGRAFRAQWWTRNQSPENPHGPWEPVGNLE